MTENAKLPTEIREYFASNYPQFVIIGVDNDGNRKAVVESSGDLSETAALLALVDKVREELLDILSDGLPREVLKKALEIAREEKKKK